MRRNPGALGLGRFDLTVVGGGILGACVAFEGARTGLRVALIDRGDFGAEASGNNLRIAHGGVRDLARLDVRRARAARRDLALWTSLVPHLIEPLDVFIPRRGRVVPLLASLVTNIGLAGLGPPGPHARALDARAAERLASPIALADRRGGFLFQDGLFRSPERILWALVDGAVRAGAVAVNHVEATGAVRRDDRIVAVTTIDRSTGESGQIETSFVINACGAGLASVSERLAGRPMSDAPAFSHSVNAILPELPIRAAVGVGDRGLYFLVPGHARTAVGTAHAPVGTSPDPEEAVAALLESVGEHWPGDWFGFDDVLGVQEGFVLAVSPPGEPPALADDPFISRPGAGPANLLEAAPPKYTDAPRLARELLRRVEIGRGRSNAAPGIDSPVPVPTAPDEDPDSLRRTLEREFGDRVPHDVVEHTGRAYGTEAAGLLSRAAAGAGDGQRVHPDAPVVRAHLRHAVERELAVTIDDVLRRTGLLARGLDTPVTRRASEEALAAVAPRRGKSP